MHSKSNVVLLHHWLTGLRGGEKVLEQFCKIFQKAPIHTLVSTSDKAKLGSTISKHRIVTTVLNKFPASDRLYKNFLPLYPIIIVGHKVDSDFILSSDASLIKGVRKDDDVPHVCYCHSPPRYLWDMQEEYLDTMHPVKAKFFEWVTPYLRRFDLKGADNVSHFIANSEYVKERIKRIYNRDAVVIHPPVALDDFQYSKETEDFYFMVSALVPYKRVDLAVEAFNRSGKKLVVIGDGPELQNLKAKANSNVTIMGSQPFEVLKDHYSRCKAFIFPGVEDFGITPLEAQASGKPVIAIKEGGALETVIDGETGLFFQKQTAEALIEAVERFEDSSFSPEKCRANAEKFSPERFQNEIKYFLLDQYPTYFEQYGWENLKQIT